MKEPRFQSAKHLALCLQRIWGSFPSCNHRVMTLDLRRMSPHPPTTIFPFSSEEGVSWLVRWYGNHHTRIPAEWLAVSQAARWGGPANHCLLGPPVPPGPKSLSSGIPPGAHSSALLHRFSPHLGSVSHCSGPGGPGHMRWGAPQLTQCRSWGTARSSGAAGGAGDPGGGVWRGARVQQPL